MNKTFAVFCVLLSSGMSLAETPNSLCGAPDNGAYKQMAQLPQGLYAAWWPEFLEISSAAGVKDWAAIMCSKKPNYIAGGSNCIVDLSSGANGKITGSPGVFDGQWTRDRDSEPLFTAPNKFQQVKGGLKPGLTFFRHSEVMAQGKNAKPVFHDPVFGNHYHSFGVVDKGTDSQGQRFVIHRALNDKWGASIRDYKATLDANGRTLSMEAVGPERNLTNSEGDTEVVKSEPKNHADANYHRSYYDLPMISADGRFFSVNNRKTMTAQIYEITPNGKRLVADLGFEAGKVSFAPMKPGSNEVKIAFHVDQVDPAEGDKMSSVPPHMTKDIVVMKLDIKKNAQGETTLERKEAIRVTASGLAGDGNYYPKWVNDHEFVYIQSRRNAQSFVKVDVDLLKEENRKLEAIGAGACESCQKNVKFEAVVALGKMFADSCTNISNKISAREAQLYSLRLNEQSCLELSQNWEASKSQVLSAASLYQLRKPKAPGQQRVPGYNFSESYSQRGAQRLEKPADRNELEKITVEDLKAVCQALGR